jgi:hypothetical protein
VLHQAIIGVLEPHLEPTLDSDSYACRKGLGMDAALELAQALTCRSNWVLKTLLTRRFKDQCPASSRTPRQDHRSRWQGRQGHSHR